MPWKLLFRESLLAFATVAAFLLDARLASEGLPSWPVALFAAVSATALAFYVHEWGHLLAAKAAGAVVYPADRIASSFLFRFDTGLNDARQFLVMSYGGFAASALVVVVCCSTLPLDRPSGVGALVLILFGVAAQAVTEFPVAWSVARGGAMPSGIVYESRVPGVD